MENTIAFDVLIQLIQVLGDFITRPIFFNLSVLNILFISFILTHVIAISIGGFPDRTRNARVINTYDKTKANQDMNKVPTVDSQMYDAFIQAGGKPFPHRKG